MEKALKRTKEKLQAIGWKYIRLHTFECGFTAITNLNEKVYVEPSVADNHINVYKRDGKTFLRNIKTNFNME